MSYQDFKAEYPDGTKIVTVQGVTNPYGVQCVNEPRAYAAFLWPSIPFAQTISSGDARTLFANANPNYFDKFANDPNDQNQLPESGDVMVFDATPKAGYTNQFDNPDGHTGTCDSANPEGYSLRQLDAPQEGEGLNSTFYPWNYRPCIGWLRPKVNQGEDDMTDENFVRAFFIDLFDVEPTAEQIAQYVNRPWKEVYNELRSATPHQQLVTYFAQLKKDDDARVQLIGQLQAQIKQLEGATDTKTQAIVSDLQALVTKYSS